MRSERTVGFAGLGVMGSPMSRHLLTAGWDVVGYDPSDAATQRLLGNGGRVASSAKELGAMANVILTSLPSFDAVTDVLGELAEARRGEDLVVVELSTLTLDQKCEARDAAATSGIRLLDCPVSGTSAQAERGDLIVYASGLERDDSKRVVPVLRDMSRQLYDLGRFGNGTKLKLVANLLVAVHNLSAAEALLLAERAGLDLNEVLPALCDGAGGSKMLEVRGPLMAAGAFDDATARVEVFRKDLRAIRAFVDSVAVPTPLLNTATTLYDAAAGLGWSQKDTASVFAVLQRLTESTEGSPAG